MGEGGQTLGESCPLPSPPFCGGRVGGCIGRGWGGAGNQQKGNEGTGEMREQGRGPSPSAASPSRAGRHGSEGLQALELCVARWGPLAAPLCFPAFTHQEA